MKFPFLNWWPLNDVIRWLVGNYSDKLYEILVTLINVAYIPFKNAQTQAQFAAAQLSLKTMGTQYGVDSPQYKAQRAQNQQAFAAHVRSLLVPSS